ncbi:MAG: outer membrane protein transport protein [Labilithrix sp.]|nr:outer membrane protein transport protein [Labilithrix sp.]MBX3221263.1 outer membrane protein transport protein [Labilithrix sp.]
MHRRTRHALWAASFVVPTFAALVCSPRDARASNVTEVPDNGSEQMGRGGAWVARASDPLATTFNPAGLAGQPSRVTIQSSLIFHHTCFTRMKAAGDTSVDLLADGAGRFPRVCNDIEPAVNPQIGATLRINDRLGIGALVMGPSSAGEKNWPEFVEDGAGTRRPAPQRYLLTRQAGVILTPTVGVGYEVLANLRLGVSFGWGFAKIKNAAATVALNSGGQTPDNDVRANLQVKDYFIPRVTGGALWSVTPEIDFAGWYQWTDAINATGDVGTATSFYTAANARGDDSRVGYGDTIFSDCGTGRPQDEGKCGKGDNAKVKFVIPMEAKVGFRYHRPRVSLEEAQTQASPGKSFRRDPLANDLFDFEVDLTWANNSAINALEVRFPSDPSGSGRLPVSGINSEVPPNADQPRQYRDVFGIRVGGDYNVLPDRLAVRAGAYIETNAGREQFQHVDFAASQRIGFALGGTYRIRLGKDAARTDAIEIMAGYGHTFFADQTRTDRSASGIGAVAGAPCPGDATVTGPNRCSDGTQRYRTSWPVNLGTITNALNVINVGVAYRF